MTVSATAVLSSPSNSSGVKFARYVAVGAVGTGLHYTAMPRVLLIATISLADVEIVLGVLYVDDGSCDSTAVVWQLREFDRRVSVLQQGCNIGKEIAMAAGLDHLRGVAIAIIDADLQDPPELIPKMLVVWKQGYDEVEMKWAGCEGESATKRWTAHAAVPGWRAGAWPVDSLGEYFGRTFFETNQRPIYLVDAVDSVDTQPRPLMAQAGR